MKLDFEKCIKDGVEQAMSECELTIGMTLKEAVEKQIPKKVILKPYRYGNEIHCPSCNHLIGWEYELGKDYCRKCGQKLAFFGGG